MAKGENIIPFSGDEVGRFHHADGELPTSPPVRRNGEPEYFEPLGKPVLAVVLRLQGQFPRVKVRVQAGEKPAPS